MGSSCETRSTPSSHNTARQSQGSSQHTDMQGGQIRQQNREVLEEPGAGVAWEQRSSSACCLLPHLDGISALLLSLGVRPAALVLV